jgi:hypothetical protein
MLKQGRLADFSITTALELRSLSKLLDFVDLHEDHAVLAFA